MALRFVQGPNGPMLIDDTPGAAGARGQPFNSGPTTDNAPPRGPLGGGGASGTIGGVDATLEPEPLPSGATAIGQGVLSRFGPWGAAAAAAFPAALEGLKNWAAAGLPPNSAQFGGDTGGVPIPDAASPFVQPHRPYTPTPDNNPHTVDPYFLKGGPFVQPQHPPSTGPMPAPPVKRDISRPSPTPKARPIPAAVAQRPDLGFYSPITGNARGGASPTYGAATWQTYKDPNDPRIYRGPLAS
jgi:hypothetical protein